MAPRPAPTILHVDLDAFFAAVETLLDPSLRDRPVVVGGLGPRGVVSTANYPAREYGVHSAMAMALARRRCPHAVYLPPNFDAYTDYSQRVMAILRDVTPIVEPQSLDEAFLDVDGARRRLGDPPTIARALRARVREETGLVASVGAATTKMLAKIASDLAKPDGLLVVEPGHELELLHPLPVSRLWGVGPATRRRLDRLGVSTVADLARADEDVLVAVLGGSHGRHLAALARNEDERAVVPDREAKSVGAEETFATDVRDADDLDRELIRLTDRVARRLRGAGTGAHTVQVKVRFPDFRTITRAHTLPAPTDLARDLLGVARALLAAVDTSSGVRLLGVSAQQLRAAARQPTLGLDDDDAGIDERRAALERAADSVRDRYGERAMRPAALAPRRTQPQKGAP